MRGKHGSIIKEGYLCSNLNQECCAPPSSTHNIRDKP